MLKIRFYETSAKTGEGIVELFEDLINNALHKLKKC